MAHFQSFSELFGWVLSIAFTLAWLFCISTLFHRLFTTHNLPSTLPWVGTGHRDGPLARAKANLSSFFRLKDLLAEGYREHSKQDQAYVLPYYLNSPEVILPPSQISWLLNQPDAILSQDQVNRQFLQAEFVFAHANLVRDPVHPEVIQHQLTRKLAAFVPAIAQEMRQSLADGWGEAEGEWVEVSMYDTLLDVVTRLSLRVFMGEQLCRDPALVGACQSFNRKVAIPAAAISLFPEVLKPIVAPLFTAYDYFHYLRCRRIILPILKARLRSLQNNELPVSDTKAPNDYLQWAIDHALSKPVIDPLELDERVITSRFAVLCFAAIQSSVITMTNTIFDIVSSPERDSIMAALREDVLQAVTTNITTPVRDNNNKAQAAGAEPKLTWTKATVAGMRRVDSAIRESMRLNGFIHRGVMKMVVAPGGVVLPDGVTRLPRGTKVGVSAHSVHRDEEIYEAAGEYRPFRFASATDLLQSGRDGRSATAAALGDISSSGSSGTVEEQQETMTTTTTTNTTKPPPPQSLVSTSDKFMGFSHGSHACPGRFFAANQLKIALAHIALHYDIAPAVTAAAGAGAGGDGSGGVKRPENKWFFGHMAPPLTAKVRVRRRGCGEQGV
ncbi:tenellin biosynthesis cytochrome P450 monooxygenase [Microdochium nivale]|nr:tenellin biosynthesis cytochrome P450 monooxygenase [Microdochium nivale]